MFRPYYSNEELPSCEEDGTESLGFNEELV